MEDVTEYRPRRSISVKGKLIEMMEFMSIKLACTSEKQ
jgi:hypothetical protein